MAKVQCKSCLKSVSGSIILSGCNLNSLLSFCKDLAPPIRQPLFRKLKWVVSKTNAPSMFKELTVSWKLFDTNQIKNKYLVMRCNRCCWSRAFRTSTLIPRPPARCVSYQWLILSPSLGIALSWRGCSCTTGAWVMRGWWRLQRPYPLASSWDTPQELSTSCETDWGLCCVCIALRHLGSSTFAQSCFPCLHVHVVPKELPENPLHMTLHPTSIFSKTHWRQLL